MKPEVQQAVDELRNQFGNDAVVVRPQGDGGVIVKIESIDVGDRYTPRRTWLKFVISFQYPYADIYPLFVGPDLVRTDSHPHGQGITSSSFEGESALQLSRRNNHLNPEIDTAARKAIKVIEWLRQQ